MPCYKCSNGKYKYGERGRCQFDTLGSCKAAEAAIHAREQDKAAKKPKDRDDRDDRDDKERKKPKK